MSDKVFLTSKSEITTQIRVIFERAEIIKCAVAFWGDRAPFILGFNGLDKPIQIICNFESGACNPKAIKELMVMSKVEVKSHDKLHAKVYWTEHGAIVGSSNASGNDLSFESYEINGWLEANIFVTEAEILKQIELWFDELWQKSHSIDPTQISIIEKFWQRRRNIRNVPGIKLGSSLLTALEGNRDNFKDFNVFLFISRHDLSEEAANTFKSWAKQENIQSSQVSCYESWSQLQADSTVVSLYFGPRGGFECFGLWYISEPKIDIKFKYYNGEKGHITICFERQDVNGLVLKEEDVALLKEKLTNFIIPPKPNLMVMEELFPYMMLIQFCLEMGKRSKSMYSIYRLNANELDVEFVEGLKTLFKDKEIEIAVYEVDETDYLTRSEANKRRLLAAIKNVEQQVDLVEVKITDLQ